MAYLVDGHDGHGPMLGQEGGRLFPLAGANGQTPYAFGDKQRNAPDVRVRAPDVWAFGSSLRIRSAPEPVLTIRSTVEVCKTRFPRHAVVTAVTKTVIAITRSLRSDVPQQIVRHEHWRDIRLFRFAQSTSPPFQLKEPLLDQFVDQGNEIV